MTGNEMQNKIRRQLRNEQGRFDVQRIVDEINAGLWDFCSQTLALTKTVTFSVLKYKRDYDLPNDFLDIRNIFYNLKPLKFYSQQEMKDLFKSQGEMAKKGTPVLYYQPIHGRFALHPIPDTDRNTASMVFAISEGVTSFAVDSTSGFNDIGFFLVSDVGEVVAYFNKIDEIASEIITDSDNRDFANAGEWANVDFGVGFTSGSGVLAVEADASGQYGTLPVLNAPMTAGEHHIFEFDAASLTGTISMKDFTGSQTFGTISATGNSQRIEFVLNSGLTGGFRIVSNDSNSAVTLDNLSLKESKIEFRSVVRSEEETSAETITSAVSLYERDLRLDYYALDLGFTASTLGNSPQLSKEYHNAIVDYAMWQLLNEVLNTDQQQLSKQYEQKYMRVRHEARGNIKRQQRSRLLTVRDEAFGGW